MDDEKNEDPPEKRAAEGREPEDDEHAQDDTENRFLDSEEHSEAPGPFGTG